MDIKIPVLVGPTAVGKTRIALMLAEKYGMEIISADSRQIYRYMDIGTAKPTAVEQSCVRHHLVDIRDPDQRYSAGDFLADATAVMHELEARQQRFIIVGGSGFYINALVSGMVNGATADEAVREILKIRLSEEGAAALHAELAQRDPVAAARIHPHDQYRILRALEIIQLTGKPMERPVMPENNGRFMVVGLDLERPLLYQNIETRVDQMLRDGLLDETRGLLARGFSRELPALRTLGYQEALQYLADELTADEMSAAIKQSTRHYAKRQMTWFRKQPQTWIDTTRQTPDEVMQAAERVFELCA